MAEMVACIRCAIYFKLPASENPGWIPLKWGGRRHVSGFVVTHHMAYYCNECGPYVAMCRVCGCTDECGCHIGCRWIETDLYSACYPKVHTALAGRSE